jgi:hypothetical protein
MNAPNKCWRCQAEIAIGESECVCCLEGIRSLSPSDDDLDALEKDFQQNCLELDWSKVKTLEQLISVITKHGQPIFIQKGTQEHRELEKFLKPIDS